MKTAAQAKQANTESPGTITSPREMHRYMAKKLAGVVPELELGIKAELAARINGLKPVQYFVPGKKQVAF